MLATRVDLDNDHNAVLVNMWFAAWLLTNCAASHQVK